MDRFIVGTGRCGSTLLSSMLGLHPDVLSVFEFFNGLDVTRRFERQPVSGQDFSALIAAEQPFVTAVLRRGYPIAEIRYPFGPGARYRRDEPLPWILVSMLPRLAEKPDALFDAVMAFATGLPTQPLDLHYRALFDWLVGHLGRQMWIERSGSSIEYLESLHGFFPEARFLHLHRDGRETALSMREHHAYRLSISLLYDAPTDAGVPASQLGPIDLDAEPDSADPVSQILASRPPVEYFGRYWSDQLARGYRAVRRLDADQYLELVFEELVAEPRAALERIAGFFELPANGDWIDRAAALIHGSPPTRFGGLGEDDQRRLAEACRTGQQLVGRSP